jgi:flavin-dependent dehydrogenase
LVFTAPDGSVLRAPVPESAEPAWVIPRLVLDDRLRQAAVSAGAEFQGGCWVKGLEQQEEWVELRGEAGGRELTLRGRVALLAVGANLKLLRDLRLAPRRSATSLAARAYFEGVTREPHQLRFHFDGVPLPGYGWIFPLAGGTANVGVGLFGRAARAPHTAAGELRRFLEHTPVKDWLGRATRVGPVKGFPLRTDFHRSPLGLGRALLVGEAAGLVNPFTGEGIDYALESAQMASQAVAGVIAGRLSVRQALGRYEQAMRARFQRYFQLTTLMRGVYMNRPALNALARACQRWPDLLQLLVEVQLGRQDPWRAFTPRVALWVLRGLAMRGRPAQLAG